MIIRLLMMISLVVTALVGPLTGRTFFEKNAQRYTQWRRVRRGGGYTAGQMTFHSYEAPLGRSVLAAATWLLTRLTPGSYHWLFDVHRAYIRLAPWPSETWHSVPTNNFAASCSAVMHAVDWRRLNAAKPGTQLWQWRQNLIYGFALASADFSRWLISQGRDPVPKRILTRKQALRKEDGFVFHRITDPGRRTDPANPEGDFPWDEFFAEYDRLMAGHGSSNPTPSLPAGPSARPDVEIQLALAVLGIYNAGPDLRYLDGVPGKHQRAAVETYQQRAGLTVDGWWGTHTDQHFERTDMSTIVQQIAKATAHEVIASTNEGRSKYSVWTMLTRLYDRSTATSAQLREIAGKVGATVDVEALAHELAPALSDALGDKSEADVEAALRRVFADAGKEG